MTAIENIAYGLRSQGIRKRNAIAIAASWIERTGLSQHGFSKPHELSGGQSQRVALARALAPSPEVLLLDEPLASVDASARIDLMHELRRHLDAFEGPRLVVAHAIDDAIALADRIVVLEAGCVVQQGPIQDIVSRPQSRYVADLVGLNYYAGTCQDGVVMIGDSQLKVSSNLVGPVLVSLHPRAVSLFRDRPQGSPRNVWQSTIQGIEPLLERVRVRLGGSLPIVAEVTPLAVRELGLKVGESLWIAVKATELLVSSR
jgi:molybdate transport system ATP-binding protein